MDLPSLFFSEFMRGWLETQESIHGPEFLLFKDYLMLLWEARNPYLQIMVINDGSKYEWWEMFTNLVEKFLRTFLTLQC